jgi:hypothetical protein
MQLATPCILYLSDALLNMTLAPIQRIRARPICRAHLRLRCKLHAVGYALHSLFV